MMKKLAKYSYILVLLFWSVSGSVMAEDASYNNVAVVVHAENTNDLNLRQILNIYLGKTTAFPNGDPVTPIDREEGSKKRDIFYTDFLGINDKQLKKHWAKLLFTGEGRPPVLLGSDQDVKARVAEDKSAIGYIDAGNVDDTVKVIVMF